MRTLTLAAFMSEFAQLPMPVVPVVLIELDAFGGGARFG